jgi:hypothetical protein
MWSSSILKTGECEIGSNKFIAWPCHLNDLIRFFSVNLSDRKLTQIYINKKDTVKID